MIGIVTKLTTWETIMTAYLLQSNQEGNPMEYALKKYSSYIFTKVSGSEYKTYKKNRILSLITMTITTTGFVPADCFLQKTYNIRKMGKDAKSI